MKHSIAADTMAALEQGARVSHWPGFDPRWVPVALYDGDHTFLFRHPHPPAEFRRVNRDESVFSGLHPAVRANTAVDLGGVATATVMIPAGETTAEVVAALVAHEAFHVFQAQNHPDWFGDESEMLMYPTTDAKLYRLQLLEAAALDRALGATEADERAGWARTAIEMRRRRYTCLSPGAVGYERGMELKEGLALYVESRFAGDAAGRPPLRLGPGEVRRRCYATGHALATLLDAVDLLWKDKLQKREAKFLDELLEQALPAGVEPGHLTEEEETLAAREAEQEIRRLIHRRQDLLSTFVNREGWRLEVVSERPLRPQGFDPMNLHRLTDLEVLHTRWLKLGNEAGAVEVFGEGLTRSAGPHPLFAGVCRLLVTGLQHEPEIDERPGSITVNGGGLQGVFGKARVVRTGQAVVLTLD